MRILLVEQNNKHKLLISLKMNKDNYKNAPNSAPAI